MTRGAQERIMLVTMAAIGCCWTGKTAGGASLPPLPVFKPETDQIVPYGSVVADQVMENLGIQINPAFIVAINPLLAWIQGTVPAEKEVADRAHFTLASEEE